MRVPGKPLVLVVLLELGLAGGCGYGDVSPATYQYAKALYNITNRKLADRLPAVEQQIAVSREAGDVLPHEADWLPAIIDTAKNKRWEKAMRAARRMMEDQIER